MTNKELNKKLAEWAGLQVWVMPQTGDEVICVHPDDPDSCLTVDFTTSLDACFKWLVPKLKYYHMDNQDKPEHWAMVSIDGVHFRDNYGETPALALCKTIEKMIDKEVKDES